MGEALCEQCLVDEDASRLEDSLHFGDGRSRVVDVIAGSEVDDEANTSICKRQPADVTEDHLACQPCDGERRARDVDCVGVGVDADDEVGSVAVCEGREGDTSTASGWIGVWLDLS